MIQDHFEPFDFLSDGGLNIHQHRSRTRTLAVFVHGFMGDGYETWGEFPRFLFDSPLDVAVFDYPTGSDHAKRLKAPAPETSARLLCQEISSLESDYEDVILLGHSMGGLVAGLAAYHYFDELKISEQAPLLPLAGLLAFASPLGGSLPFSIPGFADLRFLTRGNAELKGFRDYRNEKLDVEVSQYPNSNKYSFPMFSLSATNDIWVKRTNSAFRIPRSQAQDCGGTHKELVKPPTLDHKSVKWTLKSIAQIRVMRTRAKRMYKPDEAIGPLEPSFVRGYLIARLWDTSEPEWVEAFTDALILTGETYSLRVLDSRNLDQSLEPNLVVHPMRSASVLEQPARLRTEVVAQVSAHAGASSVQVALGPTGSDWLQAEDTVRAWLVEESLHTTPWVAGVPDAAKLRDKMVEWLRVLARGQMHTASSLPDRRRTDTLERAIETGDGRASFRPYGGD